MFQNFQNRCRVALQMRDRIRTPSIRFLVIFVALFLLTYLAISVWIAPANDLDYHFARERGAVTALSALSLGMACGFAGAAFFLTLVLEHRFGLFWMLASLGFAYFALDELLEFHEQAGRWLRHTFFRAPAGFRNWNDIIVIGYGVLALPLLLLFLPEILRYPKVAELISAAFVFYTIHTYIDSTTIHRSNQSAIAEESFKSFSSAFFALAMLVAILGIVASWGWRRESDRQ